MKRRHWIALALVTACSAVGQMAAHHEGGHWWDSVPAFYAVYGFAGCAAIVFLSKWYGKHWVQKDEGYYDGR